MIKKVLWCAKIMAYGLGAASIFFGYVALTVWSHWFFLVLVAPVIFVAGMVVDLFLFKNQPPFDI
jgi:hypothetical protein